MEQNENQPVSVGNWIVTFIITAIPLVNIIALLVWAFGSSAPPSKKNWAQAALIMVGVAVVLAILSALILPAFGPTQ